MIRTRLVHCLFVLLALACSVATIAQQPEPSPAEELQAPPTEEQPAVPQLLVDHAWVKDAESPDERGVQQRTLKTLREKVLAGGGFVASWEALGVDGTNWHVAEQESYPEDAMPEEVRALPDGAVTGIVPGHGGLHLFRVIGRPPAP